MNVKKELKRGKEAPVDKDLEKDKKLFSAGFETTLNQLEELGCPESDENWFCPETIETGGQLIADRVPLLLEVLHEEGYPQLKVNMGTPRYGIRELVRNIKRVEFLR